jgi:hypothetical protein
MHSIFKNTFSIDTQTKRIPIGWIPFEFLSSWAFGGDSVQFSLSGASGFVFEALSNNRDWIETRIGIVMTLSSNLSFFPGYLLFQ